MRTASFSTSGQVVDDPELLSVRTANLNLVWVKPKSGRPGPSWLGETAAAPSAIDRDIRGAPNRAGAFERGAQPEQVPGGVVLDNLGPGDITRQS
jgi:hypothetical protein